MENFKFQAREEKLFWGNGSYFKDDKALTIKLFFSNRRISFLQPIFVKNLFAGLILFLITVAICGVVFTVGIMAKIQHLAMPICIIIAGGAGAKMRNLMGNPERCPLIKDIQNSDIQKLECLTAMMQYPKFKLYLSDGSVLEFEANNACKNKMQEFFKTRFSVIKKCSVPDMNR